MQIWPRRKRETKNSMESTVLCLLLSVGWSTTDYFLLLRRDCTLMQKIHRRVSIPSLYSSLIALFSTLKSLIVHVALDTSSIIFNTYHAKLFCILIPNISFICIVSSYIRSYPFYFFNFRSNYYSFSFRNNYRL